MLFRSKSINPSCFLVLTSKSTYLLYESKNRTETRQYNMISTQVELHPCNQRKGSSIECKLVLLTNLTLLCVISAPPRRISDDTECWLQRWCDAGSKSILSKSLDVLLGVCKIIIAMESVRFCLVQFMLCTKLWQTFKLKILYRQQQGHVRHEK